MTGTTDTSIAHAADVALDARAVVRGYGRRRVLDGVDLTIRRGELVTLLGPNGAGKTTLLKVLVGLLPPRAGAVDIASGVRIGWVPQGGGVHGRLTVRENLRLFAQLQRLGDAAVADRAIANARLEPWADTLADDLSGGLRQRLNVAIGIVGDPNVLLLDEPTTGVDIEHRLALAQTLRERVADGCAVLHTTHDLADARTADRVVVLVGGRVRFDGELAGLTTLDEHVTLPGELDVATDPIERGLLRAWRGGEER